MSDRDELRVLRERVAKLKGDLERLQSTGATADRSGPLLVQTTTFGNYPKSDGPAQVYFAVQVLNPGGPEGEGTTPTFAAVAGGSLPFYALNLGTKVPPQSTKLLVDSVQGRRVFTYNG